MADAILAQSGIYAIRNTISGKLYVGSAVHLKNRWKSHRSNLTLNKHHSEKLQRAWNKYGSDAFVFEVLEIVPGKQCLVEREQHWIDAHNTFKIGYNCCPIAGSTLGVKLSIETRARMSASRQNMSQETRAKMSAAHIGQKMPDHVKAILVASIKGKPQSPEQRAKLSAFRKSFVGWTHSEATKQKIGRSGPENANYGKRASEETRAKLSASRIGNQNAKGFKHSEATRLKTSEAGKGRVHTDETKRKISEANKGRVVSEETRAKLRAAKAKAKELHAEREPKAA